MGAFDGYPLGWNQPPHCGTNYPFVNPSTDVRYLLADLFLSFVDDSGGFVAPFRVARMWGFDGSSGPEHDRDVLIVDANDETVFDSRLASSFESKTWYSRVRIHSWSYDSGVCRICENILGIPPDDPFGVAYDDSDFVTYDDDDVLSVAGDRDYGSDFEPVSGVLYPECCERQPPRLRRIVVGDDEIDDPEVEFVAGYNMRIGVSDVAGDGRGATRIAFDASAGEGLGIYRDCPEPSDGLTGVDEAVPDERGVLLLKGGDCFRVYRPQVRSGNQYVWEDPEDKYALTIANDCERGCGPDSYVRTYEGIRRETWAWEDLARRAVDLRNKLSDLFALWEAERACRAATLLNVEIVNEGSDKVGGGLVLCNGSSCCIHDARLRVSFVTESYEGTPSACIFRSAAKNGVYYEAAPLGAYPTYDLIIPKLPPRATFAAQFRICFRDATGATTVTAYASLHFENAWADPDYEGQPCTFGSPEVPTDLASLVSGLEPIRALGVSTPTSLNPATAYYRLCECAPTSTSASTSASP